MLFLLMRLKLQCWEGPPWRRVLLHTSRGFSQELSVHSIYMWGSLGCARVFAGYIRQPLGAGLANCSVAAAEDLR